MVIRWLEIHETLRGSSRWVASPPASAESANRALSVVQWATLIGAGIVAALASACLDVLPQTPGHAILRAVIPMAAGLACVPRRGAGCVMGGAAVGAAMLLKLGGAGPGFGALTSLALTGPCLDLALRRAASGWRLYVAFAFAGLASNTGAMLVRGAVKGLGLEGGRRPFASWLAEAVWTYPLFGIAAGLISAAICFRRGDGRRSASRQGTEAAA